ncbi:hypothetical protein M422DRAFT_86395, partial [Sphaerobolus stellatus SS14]
KKTSDIALDLYMLWCVVQHILKLWKDIGDVVNTPIKIGQAPLMNREQEEASNHLFCLFLVALLEHSLNLYLDELAEELELQHGIHVGVSMVWWTLQRLGLSHKKLSCVAAEQSESARTVFQWAVGKESPECLVCTDESAIDLRTAYRLMGWS